jgi:hypothetical protein
MRITSLRGVVLGSVRKISTVGVIGAGKFLFVYRFYFQIDLILAMYVSLDDRLIKGAFLSILGQMGTGIAFVAAKVKKKNTSPKFECY